MSKTLYLSISRKLIDGAPANKPYRPPYNSSGRTIKTGFRSNFKFSWGQPQDGSNLQRLRLHLQRHYPYNFAYWNHDFQPVLIQ